MVKNILFATDFQYSSNKVLKYAIDLKKKYHAKLIILNVNEKFISFCKTNIEKEKIAVKEYLCT